MLHTIVMCLSAFLLLATPCQARILRSDNSGASTDTAAHQDDMVFLNTKLVARTMPNGKVAYSSSVIAVPATVVSKTGEAAGRRRLVQTIPGVSTATTGNEAFQEFLAAAQQAIGTDPSTLATTTAPVNPAAQAAATATATAAQQQAATTTPGAAAAQQQAAADAAAQQQAAADAAAQQQAAADAAAQQQAAADAAAQQQAAATAAQQASTAAASSAQVANSGSSCGDGQDCYAPQNAMRVKHGATPMSISQSLAASAQNFANGCSMWHSGTPGLGENIAWGPGLDTLTAIGLWNGEEGLFRHGRGYQEDAAHYTQIVWKSTDQVGCGVTTCGGQNFVVCQYAPPGNYIDQMDAMVN